MQVTCVRRRKVATEEQVACQLRANPPSETATRTSGGEWGAYAGYEFGFLGPHASGGVGGALPPSWQHWLESRWTAAKAICK